MHQKCNKHHALLYFLGWCAVFLEKIERFITTFHLNFHKKVHCKLKTLFCHHHVMNTFVKSLQVSLFWNVLTVRKKIIKPFVFSFMVSNLQKFYDTERCVWNKMAGANNKRMQIMSTKFENFSCRDANF